ncbi:hypothetical protein ACFFJY_14930 [Fictibacillus aquaticus]|uniref:Uncharacterized protein n=1 Tax=Fictibacillus aquaticus TaxID=2021314 RepID=A0A235FEZ6_9BACL|nr:hypothetical protein [Fictibacillus aquaticus]OYD59507.1 hypothetical protein CGZ90_06345 [Fictibacillus aquaticus]
MTPERYHFMYRGRSRMTGEITIQFMDFKGGCIVRCTEKDIAESGDELLIADARLQWKKISESRLREE